MNQTRSPYLRREITSNRKNDNALTHIRLPNVLPENFQIILKYIYGGIISLNGQDTLDILKILVAADEFNLQELVDYLQNYLVKNKHEWIEQHFELTHRTSFQSNNLLELQQYCTDIMANSPEKIFKSFDFNSFPEKSLISFIKRDDLQMKEIEIWDHVLKWGISQNKTLILDPNTWTDDDFKTIKNTLQHCLPLIRFFSLSSKEFSQKVRPYKKLLDNQLYEELLNSYLDSDSKPSDTISLPRNIKIDEVIDSNIIINNLNIVSIISRWIDKVDVNSNFSYLRELYLPYTFKLSLRGSKIGFSSAEFYEVNKNHMVYLVKLKGKEEILGKYALDWQSPDLDKTKNSFIFSFKNKNNLNGAILSRAINKSGKDLELLQSGHICYKQKYYEKKITDIEGKFPVDDYEIFQIIRR